MVVRSGGVDIRMVAAEEFAVTARRLRQVADRELSKELYRALNVGAAPMKTAILESFRSRLPQGGGRGRVAVTRRKTGQTITNAVSGKTHAIKTVRRRGIRASESLAKRAAASTISIKGRAGSNPSIDIIAKTRAGKSIDLRALDAGSVRHPVFGHRRTWVTQRVPPNTFSKPVEDNADKVTQEILRSLDRITVLLAGR